MRSRRLTAACLPILIALQFVRPSLKFFGHNQKADFRQAFMRAREDRTVIWSETMMTVAMDGSQDIDELGKLRKQHILRSKLTVEAMQWQMARLEPKRWAEKRLLNASIQTSVADMNDEQREAMVQQLLRRLEVIARPVIEARKRERALIDVTPDNQGAGIGKRRA